MSQKPNMFHISTEELLLVSQSPESVLCSVILALNSVFVIPDYLNRPNGSRFETSTIYRSLHNTERLVVLRNYLSNLRRKQGSLRYIFTGTKYSYEIARTLYKEKVDGETTYIDVEKRLANYGKGAIMPEGLSFFEHLLQEFQVEIDW